MDTISEQAAALRILAKQLNRLADQVEAGQAKYVSGDFNYQINRDHEDVPAGAFMRSRPLASGDVHLRADIRFKTGQVPQIVESPA